MTKKLINLFLSLPRYTILIKLKDTFSLLVFTLLLKMKMMMLFIIYLLQRVLVNIRGVF